MVEVQVDDAAPIATGHARPARFRHEDSLQLLVATRDGLADASFASPAKPTLAFAIAMEFDGSVVSASP
jgi:hypothetical protein